MITRTRAAHVVSRLTGYDTTRDTLLRFERHGLLEPCERCRSAHTYLLKASALMALRRRGLSAQRIRRLFTEEAA